MFIKQSLNLPELDGFEASEGWLDKWKLSHGMNEKQIAGESLGVSETTVESWIERIKEFVKDMTREISGTWIKVVVFPKRYWQRVYLRSETKLRVKKCQSRGSLLHFL